MLGVDQGTCRTYHEEAHIFDNMLYSWNLNQSNFYDVENNHMPIEWSYR